MNETYGYQCDPEERRNSPVETEIIRIGSQLSESLFGMQKLIEKIQAGKVRITEQNFLPDVVSVILNHLIIPFHVWYKKFI